MSTTQIKITNGSDSVVMSWDAAQASAPIRIDGVTSQYQTADARHDLETAVRLVAAAVWPEDGATSADWREGTEAWDGLGYEPVAS